MSPETPAWKTPAWERYGVGLLLVLLPFGVFWWMCPFFGPGVLGAALWVLEIVAWFLPRKEESQ